ncbi:MAG: hypothetical protein ACLQVG_23065 [Terriglobia bacterium]
MRTRRRITLLMGIGIGLMVSSQFAAAQVCKDEESMVDESKKSLAEIITAVKQESVANFEKSYHQKNVVNKLSFLGISLDGLIACDEKTEQDSSATKEAVDAAKAEHETYSKLKEKLQHDHDTLKALAAPKDAKQFVEKLDEAT